MVRLACRLRLASSARATALWRSAQVRANGLRRATSAVKSMPVSMPMLCSMYNHVSRWPHCPWPQANRAATQAGH